ncbi:MAG: hypothetical protein HUN04_14460 [Desulfobacter sp.]|nr:MAG: hypothetical protein HUN04_14460 [Desulfobacter sp.]
MKNGMVSAMETPDTQFHIPSLSAEVKRPRLLKKMGGPGDRRLVLAQAPAGFGKTTALSQWIHAGERAKDTAWVSLSSRDNSLIGFWQTVIRSFDTIAPGLCEPADRMIRSGQIRSGEDLALCVITCLEQAGRAFILVLDDLHLISDALIYDGINFLIDHWNSGLKLMIATRKTPPLGLSRLRVSDRLLEVTEADLKFHCSEILDLARLLTSAPLSEARIDRLSQKTEGWAAALKLAILSREEGGLSLDGISGKTRVIREYFMEEVFSRLPGGIKDLMAGLGILDRFSPELINAMAQKCPGQMAGLPPDPLAYMEGRHLFLIPLDHTGQWYRFHHLFQEFLLRELEKWQTEEVAALHLTAFHWFDRREEADPAFDHALKAGRPDLAAAVLGRHAQKIYDRDGDLRLAAYMDRLPLDDIKSVPALACYYYGHRVFNLDFSAIDAFAQCLDTPCSTAERDLLRGCGHTFTAYRDFFCTGDLDAVIKGAEKALALIPDSHGSLRSMVGFMATLSYRLTGQLGKARIHALPGRGEDLLASALSAMNRSHLELEIGNLDGARAIIEAEIQGVEKSFGNNPPPMYGFLYISMAMILRQENRPELARAMFSKGFDAMGETSYPEFAIISLGEFAAFLGETGEFTRALQAADQAMALAALGPSWIERLILAQKQQIRIRQGRPDLAAHWVKGLSPQEMQAFQYYPVQLTAARYHMAVKDWSRALACIDPVIAATEGAGCFRPLMEACLLKAGILALSGETGPAGNWLAQALELAGPKGYPALFISELPATVPLYKTLLAQGRISEATLHPDLIQALESDKKSAQVKVNDIPESFNSRELEILNLFRQGASNKEAAETLFLSVNTVRWYAARIFAKLGVKRRGQAVSEALRLDLI